MVLVLLSPLGLVVTDRRCLRSLLNACRLIVLLRFIPVLLFLRC